MRSSLYIFCLFISILLTTCQTSTQFRTSTHFRIVTLAPRVYAAIHEVGGKAICNVGIVNLGGGTLIFDSFLSPQVARELQSILKEAGLPEITHVVNSHYHNDHIRGNQIFGEEVQIISSRVTADLIRSREPLNLATEKKTAPLQLATNDSLLTNFAGDTQTIAYRDLKLWQPYYEVLALENQDIKIIPPDHLIESVMEIEGDHFKVRLIPTDYGHSKGDLYLHIPALGVVFAGDLMFKNYHPYLGEGDLKAWEQTLLDFKSLAPQNILPGHGEIAHISDVDILINYFHHIKDKCAIYSPGDSLSIPVQYQDWLLHDFYELNITLLKKKMDNWISQ